MSDQQKQDREDRPEETLPIQPGHVMQRRHYERLAREAAEQK
jgi:hypothetical protein